MGDFFWRSALDTADNIEKKYDLKSDLLLQVVSC